MNYDLFHDEPFTTYSKHLIGRATSERFLQAWTAFRADLDIESHWLQPVLVLTVHW